MYFNMSQQNQLCVHSCNRCCVWPSVRDSCTRFYCNTISSGPNGVSGGGGSIWLKCLYRLMCACVFEMCIFVHSVTVRFTVLLYMYLCWNDQFVSFCQKSDVFCVELAGFYSSCPRAWQLLESNLWPFWCWSGGPLYQNEWKSMEDKPATLRPIFTCVWVCVRKDHRSSHASSQRHLCWCVFGRQK